jgi:hypothetical protein
MTTGVTGGDPFANRKSPLAGHGQVVFCAALDSLFFRPNVALDSFPTAFPILS